MKKVFKDVKKFTVKRSSWQRGNPNSSLLIRDIEDHENDILNSKATERMCCLGFYLREVGFSKKKIKFKSSPQTLNFTKCKLESFLLEYHEDGEVSDSGLCERLMEINDDDHITDIAREQRLKQLFARAGVKVKFED